VSAWLDDKWLKLAVCIVLDMIGCLSYLIPGLGETSDVAWGPISAFLLHKMFPGQSVLVLLAFAEETLPFLDFIPTHSIAWWLVHGKPMLAAPATTQRKKQ
jgi:hypothetical protein